MDASHDAATASWANSQYWAHFVLMGGVKTDVNVRFPPIADLVAMSAMGAKQTFI